MNGPLNNGPAAPPPEPHHRKRLAVGKVVLVLLLVGVTLLALGWTGRAGYSVLETYGGLGGGWAQFLVLLAVGAGAVVGGCLVGVSRLLDQTTPAPRLLLIGVTLALLATAAGGYSGFLAHTNAAERAEHACDDPVGITLVSIAERLEPGPVVIQDGKLTSARGDGTCLVLVNLSPEADAAAEIARVIGADGWSRADDTWLSPDGVSLTFVATHEPDSMTVVELRGRRAERP